MLRKIVIATLGLVLVAAGLEGVLRWWPRTPPISRPPRQPLPADLPVLRRLPELLAANQRGVFGGALYETNARGLRDRDYEIPKPEDAFRIVAFGGSTVMGSKVAAADTWAERIESLLSESGDRRFEVVNVGFAGANLAHSLARLEKHGLAYEPDLIVYGFSLTDIRFPPSYRSQPHGPGRSRTGAASALADAVREAWEEIQQIRRAPGTYAAEIHDNYFDNPAAWATYEEKLDRLDAIARERKICVLVLLHTQPTSLHSFHPHLEVYERIAGAATERGFAVAPSFDLYRGEDPRSLWVGERDKHANERAHGILTEALRRGLADLPTSCWKGTPPRL